MSYCFYQKSCILRLVTFLPSMPYDMFIEDRNVWRHNIYIRTYHSRIIFEVVKVRHTLLWNNQNDSAMRNTPDVTGGKPIAVWLESISGMSTVIPLVAFYDIHGIFREWNVDIHTYHSRFIPEGVAEVCQIFLRDTHVLQKLISYEEHCRRDRW
jgi:hypothetical protein